ncbi:DNA photolyase family protein [Glaciecola sp. XM2]|jgi:deoxyribodipyrimidine photo-lyase|uniref:cryptochrome/photolyase family protein n=1 Tax=Glaciecola sp. XM2 TaxID=1914931 RepID=UPI001BDE8B17|nr:deoxyribodipyrimidine photo-lyase [Glaciecola sp. XM2]MBT1449667.1 DNA photolyase family protein [Glaciecola sp. XM2]
MKLEELIPHKGLPVYMTQSIIWFRQDLRMNDNPALVAACEQGDVIPVYIDDDTVSDIGQPGGASKWWLHHALEDLSESLDNKLIVRRGNPKDVLEEVAAEYDATHIFWNRMYEPWARERDASIKAYFKEQNITVKSFNGSLLWEPMQVLKKDETPYKVFTPYYRNGCLNQPEPRFPLARANVTLHKSLPDNAKNDIAALALLPTIPWDESISKQWTVSEKAAGSKLHWFIDNAVNKYADDRNLPSVRGTSQLSPYLHFGQISPNQAWYAIHDAFQGNVSGRGVDTYLSELGWREFSYYLLYHFDDFQTQNFNRKFDKFEWRKSPSDLKAWQKGKTGIPIVDAGMRELWQTGYMHNRVRMIVGSFLVKNLLIDWRDGERWFWDCLVDADSASNSAGWQWVAGTGADASPYFRVFNPVLQGEKFDKEGEYVKKYCPELSKMPKKYIHQPWAAPSDVLSQANITLGKEYPEPLVDLKASRLRALDAFNDIKGG